MIHLGVFGWSSSSPKIHPQPKVAPLGVVNETVLVTEKANVSVAVVNPQDVKVIVSAADPGDVEVTVADAKKAGAASDIIVDPEKQEVMVTAVGTRRC